MCKWEGDIKIIWKETGCKDLELDRDQWRDMWIWFRETEGNIVHLNHNSIIREYFAQQS